MTAIASIDVRLFHIPLAEVLVDAKHGDHHIFELITATVHLEDGALLVVDVFAAFRIARFNNRNEVSLNCSLGAR